jgi:hypothetical protein
LRQMLTIALCLALAVCMGVAAFAESAAEPEDMIAQTEPELAAPADLSGEPLDALPDALPALAPEPRRARTRIPEKPRSLRRRSWRGPRRRQSWRWPPEAPGRNYSKLIPLFRRISIK